MEHVFEDVPPWDTRAGEVYIDQRTTRYQLLSHLDLHSPSYIPLILPS